MRGSRGDRFKRHSRGIRGDNLTFNPYMIINNPFLVLKRSACQFVKIQTFATGSHTLWKLKFVFLCLIVQIWMKVAAHVFQESQDVALDMKVNIYSHKFN